VDDRPASDTSAVMDALRVKLEHSLRPFVDANRKLDTLMAEIAPFVEGTRVALADAAPSESDAWREARSFAWLLAYRLGDQGWSASVAAAVVPAWRESFHASWTASVADEVYALMVEGYARGREDRARTEAQKGLANALPIAEVAPRVVVIVAAGALDPDGARVLSDRASAFMLRRDAKAALLDIEGLIAPTAAVLSELWAIPSAARMLGVRMVVSGVAGVVTESLNVSSVSDEGELRVPTLSKGVETLLREAGTALEGTRGFGAWLRRMVGGSAGARRDSWPSDPSGPADKGGTGT